MNHFKWKCVLALFGIACVACDYSPICPSGYQYDKNQRICLGDAGPPREDAGRPEQADAGSDAGAGEDDAGVVDDAGTEDDAQVELDANVHDAEILPDASVDPV